MVEHSIMDIVDSLLHTHTCKYTYSTVQVYVHVYTLVVQLAYSNTITDVCSTCTEYPHAWRFIHEQHN